MTDLYCMNCMGGEEVTFARVVKGRQMILCHACVCVLDKTGELPAPYVKPPVLGHSGGLPRLDQIEEHLK